LFEAVIHRRFRGWHKSATRKAYKTRMQSILVVDGGRELIETARGAGCRMIDPREA
jgi:hypothetical protein